METELTYAQQYYIKNKEKYKAQQSQYYLENKDIVLARNRAAYHKNKKEISEKRKLARPAKADKLNAGSRNYYNKNKEKVLKRTRKYWNSHKEEYSVWHKTWRENPHNRIKESVMKAKNHGGPSRGYEFDESLFTLTENPPTHCKCCNKELDYSVGRGNKRNRMSPSLDRLDNSKGYLLENTFIICIRCNTLKSNATFEEITNLYNYMINNRIDENIQNSKIHNSECPI